MYLSRSRHAVLLYHMTLLGCFETICNDPEKVLATSMYSKMTSQVTIRTL
jgi:hypothetical protein